MHLFSDSVGIGFVWCIGDSHHQPSILFGVLVCWREQQVTEKVTEPTPTRTTKGEP
jgi:hypothetical protein